MNIHPPAPHRAYRFLSTVFSCFLLATFLGCDRREGGGESPVEAKGSPVAARRELLNVAYDVTREFYRDFNEAFVADWKGRTGEEVAINQSHGGSSKQARSVLDGLAADVVSMNQSTDVDVLAEAGLVAKDWPVKFPHRASPFTSTIVFLVRAGNPRRIADWPDLIQPGLQVIIPNPKTSGNGRYSYLAAWAQARHAVGGSDEAAREFVAKLFHNVPVLDTGGRGATTTFAQRGIGDALLTFENEAWLAVKELGAGQFEVVIPKTSILAEAPVALVEKNVDRRGTRVVATAYLQALFAEVGQEIAARYRLRPRDEKVLEKHRAEFPEVTLYGVEEEFGGWAKVQAVHFADGGVFDQIYLK